MFIVPIFLKKTKMKSPNNLIETKKLLKDWEHDFKKKNCRLPTKDDIKLYDTIIKLYKKYNTFKKNKSESKNLSEKKKVDENQFQINHINNPHINQEKHSNNDVFKKSVEYVKKNNFKTEFGPTPQSNGKILSIFELNMKSPYDSPLKKKNSYINDLCDQNLNESTKKNNINPFFHDNLNKKKELSTINPFINVKKIEVTVENERLLSNNFNSQSDKCLSESNLNKQINIFKSDNNLNSDKPKMANNVYDSIDKNFTTPIKNPIKLDFLDSPSPLKTHRFFIKKPSTIYNEVKVNHDEKHLFENKNIFGINESLNDSESYIQKIEMNSKMKQKQKRTTKNYKLKSVDMDYEKQMDERKKIELQIGIIPSIEKENISVSVKKNIKKVNRKYLNFKKQKLYKKKFLKK